LKNRSGTNTIRRILESARQGATKSRIMHDTYLSSEKTSAYLKLLQENKLLRCELGNKLYHTTEKGFNMLDESNELNDFLYKVDPVFFEFDSLVEFSDQLYSEDEKI
jgi:predicted transcriptional regulator